MNVNKKDKSSVDPVIIHKFRILRKINHSFKALNLFANCFEGMQKKTTEEKSFQLYSHYLCCVFFN